MPVHAGSGRVSERVHEHLRRDILEGRLAPGAAVPSERVLATELQANRHAVREALKRLEQAGLVRISQGGPTRVLDWRDSGGLEVLLDLVGHATDPPPIELVRSVLEMRESIGVDAARRCATRADRAARDAVRRMADDAARAIGGPEGTLDDRYAELWLAIVAGSQNVAYRLALNSLLAAVGAHAGIAEAIRLSDEEGVRRLGEAIAAGDAEASGRAARKLLEPDTRAL
jgi:GntR family transcriptional repressor for pyruvate dehydrogenase complex